MEGSLNGNDRSRQLVPPRSPCLQGRPAGCVTRTKEPCGRGAARRADGAARRARIDDATLAQQRRARRRGRSTLAPTRRRRSPARLPRTYSAHSAFGRQRAARIDLKLADVAATVGGHLFGCGGGRGRGGRSAAAGIADATLRSEARELTRRRAPLARRDLGSAGAAGDGSSTRCLLARTSGGVRLAWLAGHAERPQATRCNVGGIRAAVTRPARLPTTRPAHARRGRRRSVAATTCSRRGARSPSPCRLKRAGAVAGRAAERPQGAVTSTEFGGVTRPRVFRRRDRRTHDEVGGARSQQRRARGAALARRRRVGSREPARWMAEQQNGRRAR